MKFLARWCCFALALGIASAQDKPAPRQVRFLAVGEMPPFRQEIRDGVRYELEAEPGTIPPRLIHIPLGKDPVGEEQSLEATLSLGAITPALKIPGGAGNLTLQTKNADSFIDWHKATLPERGDCLLLIWRDPQKNTWQAARSLAVADDPTTFPAGSVRLINLLPTTSRFAFADRTLDVKAGSALILPVPQSTTPVQISVLDAEQQWRVIYQSAISQNPGERGNVILYKADGVSPRSPVKVINLRERAPAPPVKKVP
jgi:hypothetical protein